MDDYLAAAAAKTNRKEVVGLHYYAAFVAVEKAIATMRETDAALIKAELEQQFIAAGCEVRGIPENFHGIEGEGTASLQLRRKTINSPLSISQMLAMKRHDIPMRHVKATFQIAEKYMDDMAILEKLNTALTAAGLPTDLFDQNDEERFIVTDETIDAIFKKGAKVAQKLIPMAANITMVTQWNAPFALALKDTFTELKALEPAAKTIEAKPVKAEIKVAAVKAVSSAKVKPVKPELKVAAPAPYGKLTKPEERKAVAEGYRWDKVKGERSAKFKKEQWVWANSVDGAYVGQVIACGSVSTKVRWIDTTRTAVVENDQIVPVTVKVVEKVAA